MTNRDDDHRNKATRDEVLGELDAADRALLREMAPEDLPDPGEAYFASFNESVRRRIEVEAARDERMAARVPWWRGLVEALRIRPISVGIPVAVAVALALVLVVRPASRIPGLDWESLDANAVAREAKRLDPARALVIPTEIGDGSAAGTVVTSDDSALEITVDFADIDATAAGAAPPFLPVADLSGAVANLSDEEWTELRTRVNEALESLNI
ncbi:MAG: hypothetical protein KJ042_08670 [Deltaproteobacteria bacterium]|nr:hypothetical protein [Deltaproteobacteria bacterium]